MLIGTLKFKRDLTDHEQVTILEGVATSLDDLELTLTDDRTLEVHEASGTWDELELVALEAIKTVELAVVEYVSEITRLDWFEREIIWLGEHPDDE